VGVLEYWSIGALKYWTGAWSMGRGAKRIACAMLYWLRPAN
jgi:hypothetical protein